MHISRAVVSIITLLSLSYAVSACSCGGTMSGNPPCQSFWNTPDVFSGRVTEIKNTVADTGEMKGYQQRLVKFSVLGDYRGDAGTVPQVRTGQGGGDCGYEFRIDEEYLVYAYRDQDGTLTTGICTPTKLLSDSTLDVEYIEGLSKAKPVGMIFGMIHQYIPRRSDDEYRPPPPLSNVRVTAESKAGNFDTMTNAEGKFRLTDLPSGDYIVRVATPEGLTGENEAKVSVREKACAARDFVLTRQNSVSGRIITADGDSLKEILVDLVPIEQLNDRYIRDRRYVGLDENGRFDFRGIPPGTYFLGIRLASPLGNENRYPRTFYPGTQVVQSAIPIVIREGEELKNLDFQLPSKLAERKIDGQVTFPDGKPAAGAMVIIGEGKDIPSRGYNAGPDGRFTVTLLEGLTYRVKAVVNLPSGAQRHAELVDIPATGDVKNIKLVLTEPNGNCPRCLR